ncbi:MAG: tetratricopeptide repeat protein, partial [Bacteroidota bacterium]
ATSYNNLASIYKDLGDYKSALVAQQKAISIIEQVYESDHPHIATSYNNLAGIYRDLGDYESALVAQQKDISIIEQVYESDHPRIATSYNNLATIYFYLKNFSGAIEMTQQAYAILKGALPEGHPNTETVKGNLLYFYQQYGDHLRGTGNYRQAIEQYQLVFAETQNGEIANSIGLCHYYLAEYSQAIEYYQMAYENQGIAAPAYWNNTGMAHAKLGQFPQAHKCFSELQKLIPDNGLVYRDWCLYYCLKGETQPALDHLAKAIELGYDNLDWLQTEPALAPICPLPPFQALLQTLQSQKQ